MRIKGNCGCSKEIKIAFRALLHCTAMAFSPATARDTHGRDISERGRFIDFHCSCLLGTAHLSMLSMQSRPVDYTAVTCGNATSTASPAANVCLLLVRRIVRHGTSAVTRLWRSCLSNQIWRLLAVHRNAKQASVIFALTQKNKGTVQQNSDPYT